MRRKTRGKRFLNGQNEHKNWRKITKFQDFHNYVTREKKKSRPKWKIGKKDVIYSNLQNNITSQL